MNLANQESLETRRFSVKFRGVHKDTSIKALFFWGKQKQTNKQKTQTKKGKHTHQP